MSLTHAQITERLERIESDLADRQARGETAAEDYHRAKRDWEEAHARHYMATEGAPTERKQATLLALCTGDAYKRLIVAEAGYEAWRAAMRTLEARSMIGMALLKASTREAGPQPYSAGVRGLPQGAKDRAA